MKTYAALGATVLMTLSTCSVLAYSESELALIMSEQDCTPQVMEENIMTTYLIKDSVQVRNDPKHGKQVTFKLLSRIRKDCNYRRLVDFSLSFYRLCTDPLYRKEIGADLNGVDCSSVPSTYRLPSRQDIVGTYTTYCKNVNYLTYEIDASTNKRIPLNPHTDRFFAELTGAEYVCSQTPDRL